MYAIAKATRYTEGQILDDHPYPYMHLEDGDNSLYARMFELRAKEYTSYNEAKQSAEIASKYNPVGFVVVWVRNSSKNKK